MLLNGQTLVAPAQGCSPDEVARLMVENRVSCASATPSYWRRLLLFADNQLFTQVPMRQITLGGELADQAVLDSLWRCVPPAADRPHLRHHRAGAPFRRQRRMGRLSPIIPV